MTAPDLPTMFLAPDPDLDGQVTLWADDGLPTPVAWLDGHRLHVDPAYADTVWAALTRVLAPDEATLTVLDQRVDSYALVLDDQEQVRWCVEDVLAALKGQVSE